MTKLGLAVVGLLASATACNAMGDDDFIDGDEHSDINGDGELSGAPGVDGLECDEVGRCTYASVDQLWTELLEIFPSDGVNFSGSKISPPLSGEVSLCTVGRDVIEDESLAEEIPVIYVGYPDTTEGRALFFPYPAEGEYRTSHAYRKENGDQVTYIDDKGEIDYKLTVTYGDSGDVTAVSIRHKSSWGLVELGRFGCEELVRAE